jgi:hypothetical protein
VQRGTPGLLSSALEATSRGKPHLFSESEGSRGLDCSCHGKIRRESEVPTVCFFAYRAYREPVVMQPLEDKQEWWSWWVLQ